MQSRAEGVVVPHQFAKLRKLLKKEIVSIDWRGGCCGSAVRLWLIVVLQSLRGHVWHHCCDRVVWCGGVLYGGASNERAIEWGY